MRRGVGDHVGHGAAGGSVYIAARCEKLSDVIGAPVSQAGAGVGSEVGSHPVIQVAAVELQLGLIRTEGVFRRMTGAAVSEARDEVRASIPFSRLAGVGLEFMAVQEERVPDPDE